MHTANDGVRGDIIMLFVLLLIAACFLAYWNGANDNFKGVATLYGSRTITYKTAIIIATVATIGGSISALFLAQGLVASFSGKGLVPANVAGAADFLVAVGFGAACTVLIATRLGFPISTTHSLVGALCGAGVVAAGAQVNIHELGKTFFIPLLISPFIACALGLCAYSLFTRLRRWMKLTKESCICFGARKTIVPVASIVGVQDNVMSSAELTVMVGEAGECRELYTDRVWGVYVQKLLDAAHTLSGATVCFARGLNDTPKIAGLLVAAETLDIRYGLLAIALCMALGGLLHARRVATTMSDKITTLNHGQGFSANLVTGVMVLFASKFGIPVSTTHVSVGAIFGIGAVTGKRDNKVIGGILLSWLVTLPIAMLFSALTYWLVS